MRSSRISFWRDLALMILVGLGGAALLFAPTDRLEQQPRPLVMLQSNVFMGEPTTLRQQVVFDEPTDQVVFRLWLLTEPSDRPRLTLRCELAGRVVSETPVTLPPADRAYHAIDSAWCQTRGEREVTLSLEGHGARIMTTASDQVPGMFSVAGTSRPRNDLVLQVQQRWPGVDRYLPVTRWAAGKPALLGSPHLYLLLGYLYLVSLLILLRAAFGWRRLRPTLHERA